MADTLKFRGLSTVQIDTDSVATREIVIDLDVNQLVIGGTGGTFSFYNTTQVDEIISRITGANGNDDEALNDLTDINIDTSNLVYGDVLSWNGTNWVNSGVDISRSTLDNLSDVNITTPIAIGDYIVWNGLEWVNYEAPSVENLSDTLLTSLNTNQSLAWNGTRWTNLYLPLTTASDVTISSPSTNQSLVWNGSQWVNSYIPLTTASDVTIGTTATNQSLVWNGSQWVNSYLSIDDANDVTIGTTATNQSLVWNGSQWVNSFIPLTAASDVDTSGVTTGQRLEYNGTNWVAVANDADTLDGLDSLQFLRSDESDTMSGTLTATGFSGDGSSLTNLDASNISSGTIGDAYLPNTISSNITGNAATADQADSATLASTVVVSSTNSNYNYRLALVDGTGNKGLLSDGQALFNPNTNTLTATNLVGDGSNITNLDYNNISNPPAASITNLGVSRTTSAVTVTCSTGTNATINEATGTNAGVMTTTMHDKLDGIAAGAQVNVATNLSKTVDGTTVRINSSTGSNTTIQAATTTDAGVMTATMKSKLDGIEAGAEVNAATNLSKTLASGSVQLNISTGSSTTINGATTTNAGVMTAGMKSKLDGIADNATKVTNNNQLTNGAGYITSSGTAALANGLNSSANGANTFFPVVVLNGTSPLTSSGGVTINVGTGRLNAQSFGGNGANLTNLSANNISSGTIGDAYLPNTISSNITGAADLVNCVSITSDAVTYPILAPGATGNRIPSTSSGLVYNVNNGTLTTNTFAGNLSGTADAATTVAITGTGTATNYRVTLGDGTGVGKNLLSDGGLVYNPSTNVLTCSGSFNGDIAWSNVTGAPTIPTNNNQLTNGAGYTTFAEPAIYRSSGTPTLAGGITGGEIRNLIGAGTSSFSGSYNDLTNKPTIPTNNNQLTNGAGYTTFAEPAIYRSSGTPTLAGGITGGEIRNLIGAGTSSFSGSYNDLTNKPTIPTNNNQLTNGAGYVTSSGSVASATNATKIDVNTSSTNNFNRKLVFVNGSDGFLGPQVSTGISVNSATNTIRATTFDGNLTGNVTGNCTGSSGSCTGNAATATTATSASSATSATNATNFGVTSATNNTVYFVAVNGTSGNRNARVNSAISGNLGTGRINCAQFKCTALAGTGNRAVYSNQNGILTNSSSDATLKTNVSSLVSQYDVVRSLNPVYFNWIDTEALGEQQEIGFIAQELQPHVPHVIGAMSDGTLTVDYPKLTSVLTKALQEAMDKIDALEQRLDDAGL